MVIQGQASAAIYADSDVVFTKPIDELWAKMKSFKESEVMAIAPTAGHALGGSRFNENFIQHDTGLFQINSGKRIIIFHILYFTSRCDGYEFHKNPQCRLVSFVRRASPTKTGKTSEIRLRAFAEIL